MASRSCRCSNLTRFLTFRPCWLVPSWPWKQQNSTCGWRPCDTKQASRGPWDETDLIFSWYLYFGQPLKTKSHLSSCVPCLSLLVSSSLLLLLAGAGCWGCTGLAAHSRSGGVWQSLFQLHPWVCSQQQIRLQFESTFLLMYMNWFNWTYKLQKAETAVKWPALCVFLKNALMWFLKNDHRGS